MWALLCTEISGRRLIHSTVGNVFTYSEHMEFLVNTRRDNLKLCVAYGPPPPTQWSAYLDQLATLPQKIIITGDLNFYSVDHMMSGFVGSQDNLMFMDLCNIC